MLRKALAAKLPVILVVNKVDRPDSRIDEVVGESMDLLLGLASDLADEVPDLDLDAVLNVPVVYASGKLSLIHILGNPPVPHIHERCGRVFLCFCGFGWKRASKAGMIDPQIRKTYGT